MNVPATNTYSTSGTTPSASTQHADGIMGKDQFLRLLVAQLRYQDPLSPMEDREFVTQLAQFSALEQMTQISRSMDRLLEFFLSGGQGGVTFLPMYATLIGKEIEWMTAEGDTASGVISSVLQTEKGIRFIVGEQEVAPETVIRISEQVKTEPDEPADEEQPVPEEPEPTES